MKKQIYGTLLFVLIIIISLMVVVVPAFWSENTTAVKTEQELDLPLILNDDKNIQLVFFGYSTCVDVCIPRLKELSQFYNSLDKKIKDNVGILFIDISVPADPQQPAKYVRSFNPDFKGLYLNKTAVREYIQAFRVFSSRSLINKAEYNHSSYLYLVEKNGQKKWLRYIYKTAPYPLEKIKDNIKELISETS